MRAKAAHRGRIVGVNYDTAGEHVLPREAVLRRVGDSAWKVYEALLGFRRTLNARDGLVRPLRATIALRAGLGEKAAARALVTLKRAGLVEAAGWRPARVTPAAGGPAAAKLVYWHRVRGALLVGGDDELGSLMAVPDETVTWFVHGPKRGGYRAGAGRPKGQKGAAVDESKPGRGIQSRVDLPNQSRVDNGLSSSSVSSYEGSPSKEGETHRSQAAIGTPSFFTRPAAQLVETTTPLGAMMTGSVLPTRPPVVLSNVGGAAPPYPGASVVAPAQVPHPPKLKESHTDEQRLDALAKWYRGAIEHVFGERVMTLSKGAGRSKHKKAMLAFADRLIAHDISPAVWCMYACHAWKDLDGVPTKAKPSAKGASRPHLPPLQVVFNPARLEDQHRWKFRESWGDSQLGGRMLFTPSHRKLIAQYERMVAAIRKGTPRDEAAASFFPGDSYEKQVDAIKLEAVEELRRVQAQIEKGKIVW